MKLNQKIISASRAIRLQLERCLICLRSMTHEQTEGQQLENCESSSDAKMNPLRRFNAANCRGRSFFVILVMIAGLLD